MNLNLSKYYTHFFFIIMMLGSWSCIQKKEVVSEEKIGKIDFKGLTAVNDDSLEVGDQWIAIIGSRILDGKGGVINNGTVIIKNSLIQAVGKGDEIEVPQGARVLEAKGKTLMPGLIDPHFHLDGAYTLPGKFLQNGVTSLRDPGAWIERYDTVYRVDEHLPRFFLTGPHMDSPPSTWPMDSYMVRDAKEVRTAVNRQIDEGVSAIKVYFRLSLGLIEEVCKTAHARGVPVTAHLEITDAREAILAGLDGIEHITSLGIALIPRLQAEEYRQHVLADNEYRRNGRYETWNEINIESPSVDSLINFLAVHETFICPTFAIFEKNMENSADDPVKLNGFQNMMKFVGKAHAKGVNIVVGSHGRVPFADFGQAYQREMELVNESGVSNMDVIIASTSLNAKFFGIDERLGSIEANKIADLILIDGNPLEDIGDMYKVDKVMLNGVWVK